MCGYVYGCHNLGLYWVCETTCLGIPDSGIWQVVWLAIHDARGAHVSLGVMIRGCTSQEMEFEGTDSVALLRD